MHRESTRSKPGRPFLPNSPMYLCTLSQLSLRQRLRQKYETRPLRAMDNGRAACFERLQVCSMLTADLFAPEMDVRFFRRRYRLRLRGAAASSPRSARPAFIATPSRQSDAAAECQCQACHNKHRRRDGPATVAWISIKMIFAHLEGIVAEHSCEECQVDSFGADGSHSAMV